MNEAAASVIVVAGALIQPLWVPPEEVGLRLAHLSAIADLQTSTAALSPPEGVLPRELAHDRWLRAQPALAGAPLPAGALAAVRRLAAFGDDFSGWLLEPVSFHLAQDHLLLLAGAADGLAAVDADALAASIQPLFEDDSLALTVLGPAAWLLTPRIDPWQLDCASSEAAAGRNVDGYLPTGPDARRYRRLLNEVQMTWHDHPVNQRREARGEPPINSLWISGPVAPAALAAWNTALAEGHLEIEDALLGARLRDDRSGWLEVLQALDTRLAGWLQSAAPPAILLCGDHDCRWLQRQRRGRGAAAGHAVAGLAGLARRLAARVRAPAGRTAAAEYGGRAGGDRLTAMFTDGAAGA